mgnify:CR=1 FL=1
MSEATKTELMGLIDAAMEGDEVARMALLDSFGGVGNEAAVRSACVDLRGKKPPTLKALNEYDWSQAFGYAGGEAKCGWGEPEPTRPGAPEVLLGPFDEQDVAHLTVLEEGCNDGDSWLVCGYLWDGRAFGLKAWCDYTGWD